MNAPTQPTDPTLATILRAAHFAARAHAAQRRKGEAEEPYVNHLLEVADLLASHGAPNEAVIAGLLHDTIEDTEVTEAALAEEFGAAIAAIVREVTDDKALPKEIRKAHQIRHAPEVSLAAKQVKLADKISNLRAIMATPPTGWNHGRKVEYVGWAGRVAAGLKGANPALDAAFASTYRAAMQHLAAEE